MQTTAEAEQWRYGGVGRGRCSRNRWTGRIAAEDLPAAAHGSTGSSGWVVSFSVRGSQATWPSELAVQLARAAGCVVYDPQQDAVTWPRGWRPTDPETRRQVIDVVELEWFIAGPPGQRTQALRLLEVPRDGDNDGAG